MVKNKFQDPRHLAKSKSLVGTGDCVWTSKKSMLWSYSLCASNKERGKYLPASHSVDTTAWMTDNSRASCLQEKSQDTTGEWRTWLLPEKAEVTVWGKSPHNCYRKWTRNAWALPRCGWWEGQTLFFSTGCCTNENLCVKQTTGKPGAAEEAPSHCSPTQMLQKGPKGGSAKTPHTEKGISFLCKDLRAGN